MSWENELFPNHSNYSFRHFAKWTSICKLFSSFGHCIYPMRQNAHTNKKKSLIAGIDSDNTLSDQLAKEAAQRYEIV